MWDRVIIFVIIVIIAILIGIFIISRHIQSNRARTGSAAIREVEARFMNVDVDDIRARLKKMNAKRKFRATLMTRAVYTINGGYARVRTEPDKGRENMRVVLTSKIYPSSNPSTTLSAEKVAPIETEITLARDETYDDARQFMNSVGLRQKAEHEQYREEWITRKPAKGVIEIDWLPGIAPSVEIEAADDKSIRAIARELALDYESAIFGPYGLVYERLYGVTQDEMNNKLRELKFATCAQELAPFIRKDRDIFARACAQQLPVQRE